MPVRIPAWCPLALALLAAPALAQAPVPGRVDDREVIVFGGDAIYPPFEWLENGKPTGFHVDLARALGAAAGLRVEHRLGPWPEAIRALETGAIGSLPMFRSEERERAFLFYAEISHLDHAIFTRIDSGPARQLSDLDGGRIAIEEQSYAHQALPDLLPDARLILTGDTLQSLQALADGRADYAILSAPVAARLLRSYPLAVKRTGPPVLPRTYAFAVRRDDAELAARLARAWKSIISDGTYDAIYARWRNDLEPNEEVLAGEEAASWLGYALLALLPLGGVVVIVRTHQLSRRLEDSAGVERSLQEELRKDPETGLTGRAAFQYQLDKMLEESVGEEVHVLLVKIAASEALEAAHGHAFLGELTAGLADNLARCENVVVGSMGAGRLTAAVQASALSDILEALRQPIGFNDEKLQPDLAIGVCTFPRHGARGATLVQRARLAAKKAQALHRQVTFYDPSLEPDPHALLIIHDFRKDDARSVTPYFQPQLDLRTGRVVALEALARWTHPELGPIAPSKLVPLLEESAQIGLLTKKMIREAARMASELNAGSYGYGISVNISSLDLGGDALEDDIWAAVGAYHCDPARLTFEITESAIIEDMHAANAILMRLRESGFKVSLDDFGTGYSSLANLGDLEIDEIKIDRKFVADMLTNSRHRMIVRSTIQLAHSCGLKVVAEGVEDRQTLNALQADGCDLAQGYVIAKPVEEEEIAGLLDRRFDFLLSRLAR